MLGFGTRFSYRTYLEASHELTPKLSLGGHAGYQYSRFEDGFASAEMDEEALFAGFQAEYQLVGNLSVNAGYVFTNYLSDIAERDYERHMFSLGLAGSF